ncbi:MAG: hypothetical protein ACREMY_33125, partial [bacterium]
VKHDANRWRMYRDSVQVWFWDESVICWTPRRSHWFGETWDFGDQIGGNAADPLTISTTRYTTVEGGAWTDTSFNAASGCNFVGSNGPFFCDVTGLQSFNIWTNR